LEFIILQQPKILQLANKLLLPLANKKDRLEFFQLALRCDSQVAGRLLRSYWKCRPVRADRSTDAQHRSGPLGSFVQDLGEALEQQTWELHEPTHQAAFDVDAMPEWDLLTQGLLDLAFHGVSAAQWDPAMPSFIVNLALRQSRWELRQRSGQALMTALLHTLALKDKAEPHTVLNVLIHRLLGGLDPAVPPIDPHRGAMAAATLLAVLEQHDRPLAERLITGHLHRHPLAGVYLGMARTHLALGEGRHAEAQGHWYATERQLGTEQEKPELALPDELRAPFESLRQQVQALSESERTHAAHPLSLAAGPGG